MHGTPHAHQYRCQGSEEIRRSFAALEFYWQRLRGAASAPALYDFDPSQVDAVLPYSLVIEAIAPGLTRVRVAGTEIDKLFDGDVRGMPFSALFQGGARAHLQDLTEQVLTQPAVIEANIRMGRARGQMMMLPLASSEGQVTRAICAMIFEDTDSRGLHRCSFDGLPERIAPIHGADKARFTPIAQAPALRLVKTGAAVATRRASRRDHLRLVVRND
ncbi:PAS domain-containing protein [Ketogulonicigenium vulgare]|uniref:PAS domain-containing protein n=1 Tax=Ketogulonicigenium vulgare (strain WSH-001) TaxID=759362 RepID=F9Y557_KETVW|nr:PAS domain-containing protein [Ketogulonicigenium vulgare]ADO42490.1 conserved hypothetical protein [Ketogulonicigenium vulgare Y25]AEM40689.1 hypothetical protein KVU_0850 [Ketogulonicigenium vulgare WSH-001]ALJ80860.1 hypothetical protein KVH_06515 [Ketogulonicigenium vulgare]ANW33636.1 hypothetical protein KvSKV_06485 [Ketogulonicigenium vulgare]AOZ54403.1 hypothetical protein KVC_1388 [Ketogulonicigenium vulgare]